MKSVMTHQFSQVPRAEIERSSFDRSHGYKTTFDVGNLVPIYVDLAFPGDTFNLNLNAFARLATPLKPFMDNMFLDSFFFAVPIRLIWNNWKKFMGEQVNPTDSTDFLVPILETTSSHPVGGLGDYFGIPTVTAGLSVSALPFRAYNLIWNEWFRDQNLQDSVVVDRDDGPDTLSDYVLKKRGKRHDYFTSCLPWSQKGSDVLIPLGANAPVVLSGTSNAVIVKERQTHVIQGGNIISIGSGADSGNLAVDPSPTGPQVQLDPNGSLVADLASASAASVNAWREAFQLQKLLERDARGGTRYTEIVRAHFGVTSDDARQQRPEYLGGGTSMVNVHPVAQTSGTAGTGGYTDTPQGNLAAFGTSSVSGHGFTKSFTEHCIVIGLVSVRADLTYQQGLNRMWSYRTKYDFYWPALAHLGEQAVLNKELYAQGTAGGAADEAVFGYQERFAELRYFPSKVTGLFRSSAPTSLDLWHLAQDFGSLPTLNSTFIEENPPIDRVVAVPTEPDFLFDAYINLKCARPMPVYSVPGLIDHF